MKTFFVLLAIVSLACSNPSPAPSPTPEVPAEVPADSGKSPGKSEDAPGQRRKVEPAQVVCTPSLKVNGVAAVPGGMYVTVDRLPSSLDISVVDCPNTRAVVRDNYVRTGFGSGEVHIVMLKRGALSREFNRLGSSRYSFGSERPSVKPIERTSDQGDSRAFVTDAGPALVKWITRPGGYPRPAGVATQPVEASSTVQVRSRKADEGDVFKVQLEIKQFDSVGGSRSLVLQESCSSEAMASPSRFDC